MNSVLVVGAGTMGNTHLDAYQRMEDVRIAGIVDVACTNHEAGPVFQSLSEAMHVLGQIDIIDVCVPTPFHKELVIEASTYVSHIICEKPLARNLKEARQMIKHCQKANVTLFVGHVVRFFPEYQRARELVVSGKLGDLGVARTFRGGVHPQGKNDWYTNLESSGGVLLDLMIHDFDFLRWTLGEVERVYAKSSRVFPEKATDYNLVTLRFKNGAIAHLEGSWAHQGFNTSFELAGRKGIVEYDSAKAVPVKTVTGNSDKTFKGVAVPESPLKENPYYRELRHFIGCIRRNEVPIVTAEDAYKAVEIALAAIESATTGKAVTIGEGVRQ